MKNISIMHRKYGQKPGCICRYCHYFKRFHVGNVRTSECTAYKASDENADWSGRNTACGLYNRTEELEM